MIERIKELWTGGPNAHRYVLSGIICIVYLAIAIYWIVRRLRENKELKKDRQERFMNELLDKMSNDPRRRHGGRTEKYEWTQTEEDLEVYVYVPPGTRAHDIQCQISPNALKMKVKGDWVLKGELFETISTDDSTWQIENDKQLGTVVWISLTKAKPTQKDQHWTCVLKGDQPGKNRPSIFNADPNDPQALNKLLSQQKKIK